MVRCLVLVLVVCSCVSGAEPAAGAADPLGQLYQSVFADPRAPGLPEDLIGEDSQRLADAWSRVAAQVAEAPLRNRIRQAKLRLLEATFSGNLADVISHLRGLSVADSLWEAAIGLLLRRGELELAHSALREVRSRMLRDDLQRLVQRVIASDASDASEAPPEMVRQLVRTGRFEVTDDSVLVTLSGRVPGHYQAVWTGPDGAQRHQESLLSFSPEGWRLTLNEEDLAPGVWALEVRLPGGQKMATSITLGADAWLVDMTRERIVLARPSADGTGWDRLSPPDMVAIDSNGASLPLVWASHADGRVWSASLDEQTHMVQLLGASGERPVLELVRPGVTQNHQSPRDLWSRMRPGLVATEQATVWTDRQLVRPGDTLRFRCMVPWASSGNGRPTPPAGRRCTWDLAGLANGVVTLDAVGGFHAEVTVPDAVHQVYDNDHTGVLVLPLRIDGEVVGAVRVRIETHRLPLALIQLSAQPEIVPAGADVVVRISPRADLHTGDAAEFPAAIDGEEVSLLAWHGGRVISQTQVRLDAGGEVEATLTLPAEVSGRIWIGAQRPLTSHRHIIDTSVWCAVEPQALTVTSPSDVHWLQPETMTLTVHGSVEGGSMRRPQTPQPLVDGTRVDVSMYPPLSGGGWVTERYTLSADDWLLSADRLVRMDMQDPSGPNGDPRLREASFIWWREADRQLVLRHYRGEYSDRSGWLVLADQEAGFSATVTPPRRVFQDQMGRFEDALPRVGSGPIQLQGFAQCDDGLVQTSSAQPAQRDGSRRLNMTVSPRSDGHLACVVRSGEQPVVGAVLTTSIFARQVWDDTYARGLTVPNVQRLGWTLQPRMAQVAPRHTRLIHSQLIDITRNARATSQSPWVRQTRSVAVAGGRLISTVARPFRDSGAVSVTPLPDDVVAHPVLVWAPAMTTNALGEAVIELPAGVTAGDWDLALAAVTADGRSGGVLLPLTKALAGGQDSVAP